MKNFPSIWLYKDLTPFDLWMKILNFSCVFHFISEATKYLVEILTPVDDEDRAAWIDRLIEAVQKQPCKKSNIVK